MIVTEKTRREDNLQQIERRQDGTSASPEPSHHLLTVEETAAALRIGRSLTYRLIKHDVIHCVRLGRHLFVSQDEIKRIISGGH